MEPSAPKINAPFCILQYINSLWILFWGFGAEGSTSYWQTPFGTHILKYLPVYDQVNRDYIFDTDFRGGFAFQHISRHLSSQVAHFCIFGTQSE